MTKDVAKLFSDFKEEMKQEFRTLKVSLERDFRTEIREMRTDLRDIKTSIEFINGTFEDMKQKIETVMSENAVLHQENITLRERCSAIEKTAKENVVRMTNCEQYSRNHNLEIKGVPPSNSENLTAVLGSLGEIVGEPILPTDIEICHRVPTRDPGKSNIVIQFQRRLKRNAVLEKAKSKRRILASDLGLSSPNLVYVNEHLCPTMKMLLGKAISKKREHGWSYVWVRGGKIFARRSESTPVVSITHEDDIGKIC